MAKRSKKKAAMRIEITPEDIEQYRAERPEQYFRQKVAEMDKLQCNGITVEHLKKNYEKGHADGFKDASDCIVKGCYAAVCLALNDLYGFGKKRCCDVLNAIDNHMAMTLVSEEAIEEVWQRMGLMIDFKEPFDRIFEV